MPPVVQSLSDLVSQYQTAQAPQQSQLDDQIAANDASGSTQQSGIDAAKNAAFTQIAGNANARGATFSGFTPNAQAGYIGATYLPALAKLQDTIASTRGTLEGDKANLNTQANNSALADQKQEQTDLDSYNNAQAAANEKAAEAAQSNQTKLEAAEISASGKGAPTATETAAAQKQADLQAVQKDLASNTGKDGKVSPKFFAAARNNYVAAGYSASEFNSAFSNFINQTHANDYK